VYYKSIHAGDSFNDLYVLNSGEFAGVLITFAVTMRWSKYPINNSPLPAPRHAHAGVRKY
jgi:hypothetical protein